jgi:hypothetical protein
MRPRRVGANAAGRRRGRGVSREGGGNAAVARGQQGIGVCRGGASLGGGHRPAAGSRGRAMAQRRRDSLLKPSDATRRPSLRPSTLDELKCTPAKRRLSPTWAVAGGGRVQSGWSRLERRPPWGYASLKTPGHTPQTSRRKRPCLFHPRGPHLHRGRREAVVLALPQPRRALAADGEGGLVAAQRAHEALEDGANGALVPRGV